MSDFCKCGNVQPSATIWHAWRVNWKIMPERIKEYLKYKYLCKECRDKVKDEIKECLQILDRSKSAEGDKSQLLWNDEYDKLRSTLISIEK